MFFIDTEGEFEKRFDMQKFVPFLNNCHDILQSSIYYEIKKLPLAGKYIVLTDSRNPALISYNIYGDTQYWWILLLYNDIVVLEELETGKMLLFPSIDELAELYFNLKTFENTYGVYYE